MKLFYFFVYNEIKIMIEEITIFGKFADVDSYNKIIKNEKNTLGYFYLFDKQVHLFFYPFIAFFFVYLFDC
jgi:hypothetical protein